MDRAWTILGQLGAIDEDDKLTALGRHMVSPMNLYAPVPYRVVFSRCSPSIFAWARYYYRYAP